MQNYNLLYLQQAKDDLIETVDYVANKLNNPTAAENLAGNIIAAAENIKLFPYSHSVYVPIKPLKHEYRKAVVNNFMLFYRVDEETKTVYVSRIIYAKRNLKNQMK